MERMLPVLQAHDHAVLRSRGDLQGIASCLSNLGNISREQLNPQARSYYEEALDIAKRLGNRRGEALVLEAIGRIEFQKGNNIQAKTMYEQCLTVYQEMKSHEDLVSHLVSYSTVLLDLEEYQEAKL